MGEIHMKNILRNAALAVSVLSIGAVVAHPASGQRGLGTDKISACPFPSCPISDPNGCGIYRPAMGSTSTQVNAR